MPRATRYLGSGRGRRGGFTLVELVVAAVISALLAVATAGSLSSILRARTRSEAREAAYSRADTAASRIARDLQSLAREPDLLHAHLALTAGGTQEAQDSILMLVRSLTPARNFEDLAEGGLYEVQYRISADPSGEGPALWRRVDPGFDPFMDGGGIATSLVSGVVALRLEATDGADWFSDWDSDRDGLPHAIRITATASDDRNLVRSTARRVVAIDRIPLPPPTDEDVPPESAEDGPTPSSTGGTGTGGTPTGGTGTGTGTPTTGGGRP